MTSNKGTEWETKGSLKIADMYKLYKSTAFTMALQQVTVAIRCNLIFCKQKNRNKSSYSLLAYKNANKNYFSI